MAWRIVRLRHALREPWSELVRAWGSAVDKCLHECERVDAARACCEGAAERGEHRAHLRAQGVELVWTEAWVRVSVGHPDEDIGRARDRKHEMAKGERRRGVNRQSLVSNHVVELNNLQRPFQYRPMANAVRVEALPSPRPLGDFMHTSPSILSAYNQCRAVEEFLSPDPRDPPKDGDTKIKLVNVRILGYLLIYLPTDTAIAHLASSIFSAGGESGTDQLCSVENLAELGQFYNSFLRSCTF
jgi:hypothetical protein